MNCKWPDHPMLRMQSLYRLPGNLTLKRISYIEIQLIKTGTSGNPLIPGGFRFVELLFAEFSRSL